MRLLSRLAFLGVVVSCFALTPSASHAQLGGIGAEPGPDPGPVCGPADAPIGSCGVVPNKELMITELCVVEDPCRTTWNTGLCTSNSRGAWTFGKLMASMAGYSSIDQDPVGLSKFVVNWLRQILEDQLINGFPVAGRPGMDSFLDDWAIVSGFTSWQDDDLVLDMRKAPFRLLAIVARLDLRSAPASYGGGNAGEGRFVFGMLNIDHGNPDDPNAWFPRSATVILEYTLPANTCEEVVDWADRWHSLGSLPFGAQYNAALQDITDDFAGFNAAPGRPNGSSISQVRTNEISFASPWELREFRLVQDEISELAQFPLKQVTVARTPDLSFNDTLTLAHFINQNQLDILNGTHDVPLSFGGGPFRAGSALVPNAGFFWESEPFNCTDTRHLYAINTCNGCHARETNTGFLHVFPRSIGSESGLSTFLEGSASGVNDPTCPPPPNNGAVTRFFDDIQRRALDMCDLLELGCFDLDASEEADIFESAHRAKTVH